MAHAGYTRATAVQVEAEVPLSELFDGGQAVVDLLSAVRRLPSAGKAALAAATDEEAAAVHDELWDRWLRRVDPASLHLGADHRGTIGVGGTHRSPVGNATAVLHEQLRARARELDGDSAFVIDGEDEWLSPEWARVAGHLQHALFAIGAEENLASAAERALLSRVYRSAFPSSTEA